MIPKLIVGNVRVYRNPIPENPWCDPIPRPHLVYVEVDGEPTGLYHAEDVNAAYGFVRFIEAALRV